MTQPRAHQIWRRGDPKHAREQPQEMERADPRLAGGLLEIDLVVRMGVDPKRRFHRAAAIAGSRRHRLVRPPGNHLDETAGEYLSDLVEAHIAAAAAGAPRELA